MEYRFRVKYLRADAPTRNFCVPAIDWFRYQSAGTLGFVLDVPGPAGSQSLFLGHATAVKQISLRPARATQDGGTGSPELEVTTDDGDTYVMYLGLPPFPRLRQR